jgi:Ankyrin repeats (3 copies)
MDILPSSRAELSVDERLVRAAMMSDMVSLARALEDGAAPNFASTQGDSSMAALMWSASEGNTAIINALLDSGLTREDINAKNREGYSAILYAFENMPSLNPRPAPPPGFPGSAVASGRERKVPRQVPAKSAGTGHAGCAKLLLMNGADLTVTNRYNETLLHLAARKGQIEWVDILLQQRLSPSAKCRGYQHTPITLAAIEVGQQALLMP